jgi:rhodanese-related sulfurtransferase
MPAYDPSIHAFPADLPPDAQVAAMTQYALSAAIGSDTAPAVLDVRTSTEYAAGHVRGAINIPFNEVGRRVRELDALRERPLIVYCGHGPRAWIAGFVLRRHRFRHISYLRGHMAAWRRAGLPEEMSPSRG